MSKPLERLKYHVTGSIERGEKVPIVAIVACEHANIEKDRCLDCGEEDGDGVCPDCKEWTTKFEPCCGVVPYIP